MPHRFPHRGGIERVDDQRLEQFLGRARKHRKDQHALFVIARCDEFLGYEVHAVVKTGDHADIGRAIDFVDLLPRMVFGHEQHGCIAVAAIALVDIFRAAFAFAVQPLIIRQRAAAWCRDLQERDFADPFGVPVEQFAQRAEPVDDALGVVEPLHADA